MADEMVFMHGTAKKFCAIVYGNKRNLQRDLISFDAMTSATAVVRSGTSVRKRTGEPLDDGHRTLDYFAQKTFTQVASDSEDSGDLHL
eukprot:3226477-Amphidinium_carterae.1